MAIHGYVTHAAYNRRLTRLLFTGYLVAFQLIAVFVLTWFLLIFDHDNTVLSNPAGYAARYALPVAIVTGLQFWWLYRGHANAVIGTLGIRLVERSESPRFVDIAETACTALGVRLPKFGLIDVAQPNALTVGSGPDRGLIAVTQGLLDSLDDDELAAVLTHEASHIRQGDTQVLAANHALMRTAVILQVHNILRIEDWRALFIPICLPATLPLFLVSGMATMASMRLARTARRGVKLSRDHIADGETIRVTNFPEALIGALHKIEGRGAFPDSHRVDGLLFEGQADHEGGSHPTATDRIEAISSLGSALLQSGRVRRDTRPTMRAPAGNGFGRRGSVMASTPVKPPPSLDPPEKSSLAMLMLFFTDRPRFWRWQNACLDFCEWRANDERNIFGLQPKLVLPVILTSIFVVTLHWPADGDFSKFGQTLGPGALVEMAREVNSGPSCVGGGSWQDGVCR